MCGITNNLCTSAAERTSVITPSMAAPLWPPSQSMPQGLEVDFVESEVVLLNGKDAFSNNADDRKIYVLSDNVERYKGYASYLGVDDENDILPIEDIVLADAADNSARIAATNGYTLAVTLQGRTLYKDGKWNTLCLPFDVVLEGHSDRTAFEHGVVQSDLL